MSARCLGVILLQAALDLAFDDVRSMVMVRGSVPWPLADFAGQWRPFEAPGLRRGRISDRLLACLVGVQALACNAVVSCRSDRLKPELQLTPPADNFFPCSLPTSTFRLALRAFCDLPTDN